MRAEDQLIGLRLATAFGQQGTQHVRGEERIVVAAVHGAAIDGAQDGFDLLVLEVPHGAAACPLERDGEERPR